MKKNIVLAAIMMAMTIFWLPSDSNVVSAQARHNNARNVGNRGDRGFQIQQRYRSRRLNQSKKKYPYGYRNYGQYRRTQVGHNRYRLVRRPYYYNGIRRTRLVRVYF